MDDAVNMGRSVYGATKTVAVVDDDHAVLHYLSDVLECGGYESKSFSNGQSALRWIESGDEPADLLLSDIDMPGMNGLDLLRTVKSLNPDLPFILVSGHCDLHTAQGALRAGATDYLLKPVSPDDLIGLVSKHLDVAFPAKLEAVRQTLTGSLSAGSASEAQRACELLSIFNTLGLKRFETLQHSLRVAAFAQLIARELNLGPDALLAVETGALLHDIGKIGIPHNVLMKPGTLNDEETAIMRMHPRLGLDLLSALPGFEREMQIVYSHHERFDGSGYPEKLVGEVIPLGARIFSVADALDAITSERCYRSGRPFSRARAEIRAAAGSQFDPGIVEVFDRIEEWEFEAVRKRFPDEVRADDDQGES